MSGGQWHESLPAAYTGPTLWPQLNKRFALEFKAARSDTDSKRVHMCG